MNTIQAIFLGAVQGLAEFLPISSSGHLKIVQHFIGASEVPLLFDILLHLATLLAVCIVYRTRIVSLCGALGRWIARKPAAGDDAERSIIVALVAGTVMTGFIGLVIKDFVENIPLVLVSACLAITGVLLFASGLYRPKKAISVPGWREGIIIGLAQGIGVTPGISRSGITISASLLSGVKREQAGEFSFLLSIPAIVAAFILELKDADILGSTVAALPLIAGMVTAFVVGYLSLKFLIGLINRGKLGYFAWYLVPAGIALSVYFAFFA